MHAEEELLEGPICIDCGSEVFPLQPAYNLAEDTALCLSCAVRRGGAYDAAKDRWIAAPHLGGLPLREL